MSRLNKIFTAEVVLFALIVLGILPRSVVPYFAVALALYVILAPLEEAILFFVQSIPLFIAIPLTADWDNFNTWRILSLIIFLRWVFMQKFTVYSLQFTAIRKIKDLFHNPKEFSKKYPVVFLLGLLLIISCFSLFVAHDLRAGVARIIYFVNLSCIGIAVYALSVNGKLSTVNVLKSISTSVILVVIVGYLQLASTYLMDIYQFMRLWGEEIQLRQFGAVWSTIAVRMGNTWLAYYGPQLSLRVFSLFPDSHSFPLFVLLGIPALFAFAVSRLTKMLEVMQSLKKMLRTYTNMSIIWVVAAFLIVILSGTRGIWAASIPVGGLAIVIHWFNKKQHLPVEKKNLFHFISLYLIAFFMLFAVAYPIFVSPQFLLSKGDWNIFGERIKSIIDFGETSNSIRLQIWHKSLISIAQHPFLGVGIGNFPVVLGQDVFLAKAGSTAHNVYLHIAAELGIPALLLALWLFLLIFERIYENFRHESDPVVVSYWASLLLFYPWVLAYLMTDAALFDERMFLLFAVTAGLVFGKEKTA